MKIFDRIIILPCKIGDTVYEICRGCISGCEDEAYGCYDDCMHSRPYILERKFRYDDIDRMGKDVFLKEDEARKKEIENEGFKGISLLVY